MTGTQGFLDFATDLDRVAEAYAAMDGWRAVKAMLTMEAA